MIFRSRKPQAGAWRNENGKLYTVAIYQERSLEIALNKRPLGRLPPIKWRIGIKASWQKSVDSKSLSYALRWK
jgi:hypothetical protein